MSRVVQNETAIKEDSFQVQLHMNGTIQELAQNAGSGIGMTPLDLKPCLLFIGLFTTYE